MSFIYNLLILIYSLLYLPYALFTRRLYKGFEERLGFLPDSLKESQAPVIWVHAVSVGEVMVATSFIKALKNQYPSHEIVFSVTTKTGHTLAQEKLASMVKIVAAPIDFSFVAKRFIKHIKPQIYIALETEIWPNLFHQLRSHHIPIVIVNGRISDQSFPRYQLIKGLLKGVLSKVSLFCMQSLKDQERIISLGAPASLTVMVGNMKFDDIPIVQEKSKGYLVNANQWWWVAGSTHSGEEAILLNVFSKLKTQFPDWRLILAPRHIERAQEVSVLVKVKGFEPVLLSQSRQALSANEVMVVDTLGQLRSLYGLSSLVFVGKSLCVGGGHNIIEPAVYAKPILIGPLMANFRDVTACFKQAGALVEVGSEEELIAQVCTLMSNQEAREQLGQKAFDVVRKNQGATQRSLNEIKNLI